jgi:hypothetical protein
MSKRLNSKRRKNRKNGGLGNGTFTVARDLTLSNLKGSDSFVMEEQQLRFNFSSSGFPQFFAMQIQANDMSTAGTFANLFDLYRIEAVEVLFRPVGMTTVTDAISGTIATIPSLYALIDYNDATVPTGLTTFQRGSSTRSCTAVEAMRVQFRPRYANAIYLSAVATAYTVGDPNQWLSTTAMGIPHYGLKIAFSEDAGTGAPGSGKFMYNVFTKITVAYKRRK